MNQNINIMENLTCEQKKEIKRLLNTFKNLKNTSFATIKEYESTSSGEIANHNILINFKYENAVKKDIEKLKNITANEINEIAKNGNFKSDLVLFAVNKLINSFEKNQNKETASNSSHAQNENYFNITNSVRLHFETGRLYIYGMTISKTVLVKGEYKPVNSRELTLCQNAIKKHLNFSTTKFRQYIIDPQQLDAVTIAKDIFKLF